VDFAYDVFLSYREADRDEVAKVFRKFEIAGLRVFQAVQNMAEMIGQSKWEAKILAGLEQSDNLAVFCSANTAESEWVAKEIRHFEEVRREREERGSKGHLILAIPDPRLPPTDQDRAINSIKALRSHLRPNDTDHAVERLAKCRIDRLKARLGEVQQGLERARRVARESFDYYQHARFWKPFSEVTGEQLHIFTCGRATPPEPEGRGAGGRTNIDIWDYQAAVDITHHFARHHHETGVFIEEPMRKSTINEDTRTFDTHEYSRLLNHNSVIIGSPDVSDFAEIALAKILGVSPYEPQGELNVAFRIRKAGKRFSTFYQAVGSEEQGGGIELWDGTFYQASDDKDYGVLVLADNPFSDEGHKILILAGHSGVATRAMTLLLTSDEKCCLEAFYELDQQAAVISGPIAAVIEVSCRRKIVVWPAGKHEQGDAQSMLGDDREIKSDGIKVCRVIDLSQPKAADPRPLQVINLPRDPGSAPRRRADGATAKS
jgi:hypothetical protein